jgi:hypothetical protein
MEIGHMASTHTRSYRGFDIKVELDSTPDGKTTVTKLELSIRDQEKRVPLPLDAYNMGTYAREADAIDAVEAMVRTSIDGMLDSPKAM